MTRDRRTCSCGHPRADHYAHDLGQDCYRCGFDGCRAWAPVSSVAVLVGLLARPARPAR